MEKLIDKSVLQFIDSVASKEPAPGGGSVAALSGAIGAALSNMVSNLTVGKKFYNEYSDDIKASIAKQYEAVEELKAELVQLIDEDTEAYNQVMAAFKLPKDTDEDKAKRTQAIQKSYNLALQVPLRTARQSLEVLKLQSELIEYGNPNAITDIGVSVLLCNAAVEGAILNVKINLSSIKDESIVNEVNKECQNILEKSNQLKLELMDRVNSKL